MVTRLKLKYDVATEQTRTEEKPCETFGKRIQHEPRHNHGPGKNSPGSLQNEICESLEEYLDIVC